MAVAATPHGILGLGTPWTRALFPGDARAEAETLIPVGYQINVAAVNGRPGPWRITGYRIVPGDRATRDLVRVLSWTTHSPQQMVAVMARQLEEIAAAEAA